MEIDLRWSWELPECVGTTCVVIDVNAATTNLPLLLSKDIRGLTVVNEGNVLSLKKGCNNPLVIGESKILPEKVFDASNLPPDFLRLDFTGREVLYMSNNGSRVIEKLLSLEAGRIITASFVNLEVAINWLRKHGQQRVLLIPAGERYFPGGKSMEDYYCAQYIQKALEGENPDLEGYLQRSRAFMMTRYDWPNMELAEKVSQVELTPNTHPLVPWCYRHGELIKVIPHLD
ncbi:MAG: 2-phosphosulfolactate phosphatase [bacterium]|nr:2-phosphosulfolactate phosphatase [bacterium]